MSDVISLSAVRAHRATSGYLNQPLRSEAEAFRPQPSRVHVHEGIENAARLAEAIGIADPVLPADYRRYRLPQAVTDFYDRQDLDRVAQIARILGTLTAAAFLIGMGGL